MKFLGKEISLIIFDLDGTLFDSTSLWEEVDKTFFGNRGMDVPPSYGVEISTMGLDKAAAHTKNTYLPELDEKEILEEWDYLSKREYEEIIPLKEGAASLLKCVFSYGVPLAIATANSPHLYKPALKRLGIDGYFTTTIDPSVCKASKNSTRLYDELCSTFGVHKENVIVIEDSLLPLSLAKKAGYLAIGVYDHKTTKDEEAVIANSNLYVKSLKELQKAFEDENK